MRCEACWFAQAGEAVVSNLTHCFPVSSCLREAVQGGVAHPVQGVRQIAAAEGGGRELGWWRWSTGWVLGLRT